MKPASRCFSWVGNAGSRLVFEPRRCGGAERRNEVRFSPEIAPHSLRLCVSVVKGVGAVSFRV